MSKFVDLTGIKFGRLTVLSRCLKTKGTHLKWNCLCDCGNRKDISGISLRSGVTKSCGCYQKMRVVEVFTKHGMTDTKLHVVWKNMKARCYNEKSSHYKYYGKRGIKVCNEWLESSKVFMAFCIDNGWNENLQIDRIDTDGNYEPSNCRFVTLSENMQNNRGVTTATSKYKGVHWSKAANKWVASIKRHHIGCFNTEKEAAVAYNEIAQKEFGSFAYLNKFFD